MACLIVSLIRCGGYWADNWNVLDGTIVLLSLFEILVTEVLTVFADGEIPQLSFLRMLRLLRIARALRLMKVRGLHAGRYWPTLHASAHHSASRA